ncbi:MAG: peptidoglycan DD-metalloendopeptidase family protein [Lachnospiraceae bacterium]|nr:peptidoglycan DD-metalloendopeptidase family protein [Lachnospiraceae bacterium]
MTGEKNEKKKKRRASYYYAITISNDPKTKVRSRRYTHWMLRFFEIFSAVLVLVIVGFVAYANYTGAVTATKVEALKQSLAEEQERNEELTAQNDYLNEKISILSETVNQKTEVVAQIEEKSLPTGYPLSGTADLSERYEDVKVDGEMVNVPMIEFTTSAGTYVVASGDGTVSMIKEEPVYGWEVRIDHGNGYVTIYRAGSEPKVKQGDEIPRGGLLYELETGDDGACRVAYQITNEGKYIEPTEMLKIEG